ncbi:MAG TPA: plastocyanin/azurin family copper-binding protein [Candidatus Dormibacteraeota bacterium]|nr:plastocyanin/azurin family copper-binding protein [Candidatus Dormibacteraeota bacterium]
MKKFTIIVLVILLAAAGVGTYMYLGGGRQPQTLEQPASSSENPVATNEVIMQNTAFNPKTITIKKGTLVTWTNQDADLHDVISDQTDGPRSALLGKGESYSFTFTKAGTYTYLCQPHAGMTGTVIVTE